MGFDLKGITDLLGGITDLFGNAENHPELSDLFNEEFMSKFTNSKSIQSFLSTGTFEAVSLEEIGSLSQEALNDYVEKNTQFANWQDMLASAAKEYVEKKITG